MRPALLLLSLLAPGLTGCAAVHWLVPPEKRPEPPPPAVARFRAPIAVGQVVLHADFALPPGHRMVQELLAERELIAERLGIPPGDEPVHIFLFGDDDDYRRHVAREFPAFPQRRAIFVETDVRLAVYAHWSDRVAEDLRHEAAHGYLHSTVPNLPLWLDEGLAEYFEVGRGRRGVNRTHVDDLLGRLAGGGWQPNLARLEALADAAEMTQLDYAEAWLWVHYLLDGTNAPEQLLNSYLVGLQSGDPPTPIGAQLPRDADQTNAALVAHLQTLAPAAASPSP